MALKNVISFEKLHNKVALLKDTKQNLYRLRFNGEEERTFNTYKEGLAEFYKIMNRIP